MELVLLILITVAGTGLSYTVYRSLAGPSVARALSKLPVTSPEDITAPGRFRLNGRVVPIGQPPVSEPSGRPYVARDLRIAVSGDGSSSTRRAGQAVDFLLDAGTTRVLVRAGDAAIEIHRDVELPKTTLDQVMWLDPLLRASGYHTGSPARSYVRVSEGVLGPGAEAEVLGQVSSADEVAASLGASLVVEPRRRAPVMIRAIW